MHDRKPRIVQKWMEILYFTSPFTYALNREEGDTEL